MWQPPLAIPWLRQACHHGKEKRECQPPVTQTHQHSVKSEKSEVFSAKAARKRQARLPVGLPSATGWVGHCGSVWDSPKPVGAPRAGGCVGQGRAERSKLGRSISDLNRARVLGPRSWCGPGSAEAAAASRDWELTRHCCLTLLLQLSQGPSCTDFCFTFT